MRKARCAGETELERLRISFEQAKSAGFTKYIMFLHYPPTSIGEQESCFTVFIAKVKYRKLQPPFVGNCRINGWGKCRF